MTLDDILNTNLGVTIAFMVTWAAAVWAYRKNMEDHNALGDKVEASKKEMIEAVKELGTKVDAVREAISHHEAVWHAPAVRKTTKKAATKKNK